MTTDGEPCNRDFEIACTQDRVELVLFAREPEHPGPTVDDVLTALRGSPLATIEPMVVARALSTHAKHPHTRPVTTVGYPALRGDEPPPCAIVVSLDRLAAWVVPVSPSPPEPAATTATTTTTDETGGTDGIDCNDDTADLDASEAAPVLLTATMLRQRLANAGVVRGLLDETIDAYGDGVEVDEIRCVARGVRPVPGVHARLEYHIESQSPGAPTGVGEGSIDLHALSAHRFVAEGTALVTRRAPVAGVPGFDVRGVVLEPPPVRDLDLPHVAGQNTLVEGDELRATIAGRPVVNPRGAVDVLPVFEVPGNLDFHVGNIEFPGDVIVRGDVRPGFAIVAGGSVTIGGLVEGASITAGHDLTVLGTVGEHRTTFEVGGDLRARYLHTTDAHVGGAVIVASEIVGCTVIAERITTNAQGRIVGGHLEAASTIDTGMLGSREGRPTEAHVTSDAPDAVIRVRRTVEPGILLAVGAASLRIRDEVAGSSFWNVHGQLVPLSANAEVAMAEARRAAPAA